jgi:hypothetical protein
MLVAILASGLLLRVADADAFLANVDATKAAYGRCVFRQANGMYRGSVSPDLERSVTAACRSELTAWEDAMTAGASPAARSAASSAVESMVPGLVSMAVRAVAECKKNAANISASDRALCETGGY